MSAATAAFLGSGRRVRGTAAPPTTVNRACYLVAELDPIADARGGDPGICNGPTTQVAASFDHLIGAQD
jgi:hypothetical protein